MDDDLEKKLFDEFPHIFAGQKDSVITDVGIEAPDAWLTLIRDLCLKMDALAQLQKLSKSDWPYITQIKEKFGTSCIYVSFGGLNAVNRLLLINDLAQASKAADELINFEKAAKYG